MPTLADLRAQDDADTQAAIEQNRHEAALTTFQGTPKPDATPGAPAAPSPSPVSQWLTELPSRVGTTLIDAAVGAADRVRTHFADAATAAMALSPAGQLVGGRTAGNAAAGAVDAGVQTVDFVKSAAEQSAKGLALGTGDAGNDLSPDANRRAGNDENGFAADPVDPIWSHSRAAIMDFRDALAVKDPTTWDGIEQSTAQFMIPFAGYSRLIGGINGVSRTVAHFGANLATAATSMDPNGGRFADLIQLERHTQGKLANVLNEVSPDGSALNEYINWASDHSDKSDFSGRLKNMADMGLAQGVIDAGASALKWGYLGLRHAIDNGVASTGALMPTNQVGAVGTKAPTHEVYDGHTGEVVWQGQKAQASMIRDRRDNAYGAYRYGVREVAAPTAGANNASGESAASQEAQNWVRAQAASGVKRFRLDPDGAPTPMTGIEARDPRPLTGHPVIDIGPDGKHEIIERGGLTQMQANGLAERAKALHGLGPKQEK